MIRGFTRPGKIAGIAGMALVAALYMAHAMLLKLTGEGLALPWLLLLVLPGVLAAYLSVRSRGKYSAEREGALAGLLSAHFAAILQVVVLVIAVLNIDWPTYISQVDREIAPGVGNGVREMAAPATAVASLVLIAITYTGCIVASWLGAVVYAKNRGPHLELSVLISRFLFRNSPRGMAWTSSRI